MISVCKEYIDPQNHQAVTVLIDSFGVMLMVQTRILVADHAPAVEQARTEMAAREEAFIGKLKANHNYSDEQIAQLQKTPADCGCQ